MLGQSWFVMNSRKILKGLVFFFTSLLLFIFLMNGLIPEAQPLFTDSDYEKTETENFSYVAIGDSLTEGVGDTTGQGGFVPLLDQSLENEYGYSVTSVNYGVSGNTSNQILKRMQEQEEIADSLATADLMTLTVGGNDIRKVIINNLTDLTSLSATSFVQPAKKYSARLEQIIELARAENADLPIYVLGIYNPFYLSFPELTEMQTIVDNWNETTEETVEQYDNVYFVPINDLLYKGIDGEEGISADGGGNATVNDALTTEDYFHPNNVGYEIMKQAVLEKIDETKDEW